MNRTLKTYLLWLLIAVMPFQAFAANVLRTCNSGHQGMTMVAATSMDHSDASASSHDAVMDQQSGDEEECSEMASSDDQDNDASKSLKHGSCSACAACFVCAVAPPQLLTFKPSFNSAEVYVTFGSTLVAGFIPDSLERPPRLLAA
ncbi:hypothetical protein G4G28_15720 [Massilia sp. Dwa41.01b]|uniref:hypothetical protein n=1 Tax=unclassified Massilia TaxID=2609279 RepID=UPI0015FFA70B|nr:MULTISPECIES: hypothetical protein [unclassified Massilia]QNA89555.1 hypothetical protein G4G28_15720 [Massilia sp. Dwa41.01b]QNB00457.1 hypothetical protein G4G31_19310 [Massilia sp. Se16.2.3]